MAALFPIAVYAQSATTTASGASVTYSQSTELTCTENATLNGNLCYCNVGYKVSGSKCVKDDPPPPPPTPAAGEIYQDIASAVAFNIDLSCTQLGMVTPTDIDMCTRYRADTPEKRAAWKLIQRPAAPQGVTITNPWAPPSQQIIVGGSSTTAQVLPPIVPPPPPPPPPPAPTPTTTPADPSPAPNLPAPKTAEELAAPPAKDPAPTPPTPPPPPDPVPLPAAATSTTDTQTPQPLTNAELLHSLNVSELAAGLTPITGVAQNHAESASVQEAVQSPSIFSKIAGWFFSLF